MPKIKPETKVLIIKNLKSKSPAEVADIFNVSKRQVERIRKRYQETGGVHDRPSDHYLVMANIKLKLRKVQQQGQQGRQLDIGKLKCQNIDKEFVLELRNRFGALGALADSTDEDPDIHTKWETIKNTYVEAATKILGYRDKKNK
ncbi:hypothetical protein AAFF_G00281090 [Aldrovandia affinis]|uniref:Uncharacterized protein n=1 Tax=Aldrovandia affinis TaxID=143900 RepID=A0AAD7W1N0_9TELE|nr:hypothetical protein AAFF_G00281090 [Aldrovandia affinis]